MPLPEGLLMSVVHVATEGPVQISSPEAASGAELMAIAHFII